MDGLRADSGLGGVALHLHAPKAAARTSAAAKIPNHSRAEQHDAGTGTSSKKVASAATSFSILTERS